MKNIFILTLLVLSFPVFAQKTWHVGASYVQSQIRYEEPGVMKERGKLTGYQFELRYTGLQPVTLGLDYRSVWGHLEYDGATWSGTPLKQTTDDSVKDTRALLYYPMGQFAPYIGYGKRYWRNDLVISYMRDTTYYYLPIGLQTVIRPFFFNVEYKHFLKGVNTSFMHDIDDTRKNVTMDQETGRGLSLEAGFLVPFEPIDFKVSLTYEKWNVENSELGNDGVDTLIEPKNNTSSYILSVGIFY